MKLNTTYYSRHREKAKEAAKSYYRQNRESVLERMKLYRMDNKEHIKAYNHAYYLRVTKIKRNLTKNS